MHQESKLNLYRKNSSKYNSFLMKTHTGQKLCIFKYRGKKRKKEDKPRILYPAKISFGPTRQ